MPITDTAGNPLTAVNLTIVEQTDSATIRALVPCRAGFYLTADNQTSVSVFARRYNVGASFQNLDSAPINLTPFAGQTIEFEFKITAGDVSQITNVALPVRVTRQV
jgi:hypothetical protein